MKQAALAAFTKLLASETFWFGMVLIHWLFLSSKLNGAQITQVLIVLAPAMFAYKGVKQYTQSRMSINSKSPTKKTEAKNAGVSKVPKP